MKATWKDDIAAIILRIMSEETCKYKFSSSPYLDDLHFHRQRSTATHIAPV